MNGQIFIFYFPNFFNMTSLVYHCLKIMWVFWLKILLLFHLTLLYLHLVPYCFRYWTADAFK
ncbi:hypothetical protein D0Y65_029909 [Glycine soja]|uniref:Uncharacterized protein n=1 Tax=Glycine soja TaxID=3848 RepID=A0A445I1C0_GLYSO|nr:hypothetical protein D0Y65_029909 [Glycine soja]